MKDRMSIIKQNAALYRKSNKKQKSIILDELTSILHLMVLSSGVMVAR